MNELFKIISGLDILGMVFVGLLLRYFFMRLRKSEDDLQYLKKDAITKQDLDEILELKLAPHTLRLANIEKILDKISRIMPIQS